MFELPTLQQEQNTTPVRFRCERVIAPMVNMGHMFAFYKPSSTQSEVDPEKLRRYSDRVRPTSAVTTKMLRAMQSAISSEVDRTNAANCITAQIRVWADKGALLENVDDNDVLGKRQAVLIGSWTAVALANAYAVAVQADPHRSVADQEIRAWFERLSSLIITEFTPPPEPRQPKDRWLDAESNHRYWAAAAVALMAVHTQDRASFDWAMNVLRCALDHASTDGGLQNELSRGSRAAQYQNFATQALSILVALADANGAVLTPNQERKLQSVVAFAVRAYVDPNFLEARGFGPQVRKSDMVTWIDNVLPHIRKRNAVLATELDAVAAPLRPMTNTLVGLPSTLLFR
jgi:hypothetical protein